MKKGYVCLNAEISRRAMIQIAAAGAAGMFSLTAAAREGAERPTTKRRTVGYLLFEGVDVLDVSGPYEVFGQARLEARNDDDSALFTNCTIAENRKPIRCENGLTTTAEYTFDNHPTVDIWVVPGGPGVAKQRRNRMLLDRIVEQSKRSEITAGVCTGAFLLAEAGLLDGRSATTYWQDVGSLRQQFPKVNVLTDTRYVDEGKIVTSAGISAGIDMGLELVERLHGERVAAWTARRIEYSYWPQAQKKQDNNLGHNL
jgi:transcriptional regulator GlxA family with amidase domain